MVEEDKALSGVNSKLFNTILSVIGKNPKIKLFNTSNFYLSMIMATINYFYVSLHLANFLDVQIHSYPQTANTRRIKPTVFRVPTSRLHCTLSQESGQRSLLFHVIASRFNLTTSVKERS